MEDGAVGGRISRNLHGVCPPAARSFPAPSCDHQKCFQTLSQVPGTGDRARGGKMACHWESLVYQARQRRNKLLKYKHRTCTEERNYRCSWKVGVEGRGCRRERGVRSTARTPGMDLNIWLGSGRKGVGGALDLLHKLPARKTSVCVHPCHAESYASVFKCFILRLTSLCCRCHLSLN